MSWMDGFTGGLLLKTATSWWKWNDVAASLFKELKNNEAPKDKITQAKEVLMNLWYKEWAIVELMYWMWTLWKIVWFNDSTMWLYSGDRYPIIVESANWKDVYGVLSTHYENIPAYKENPQQLLVDYEKEILLKVVSDIDHPEAIIQQQGEIFKKDKESLIELLDNYEYGPEGKIDYVYKYTLACLEKIWYKELDASIHAAWSYIESNDFMQIENEDAKKLLEDKYYGRLTYYNEHHHSFGVSNNQIVSIYTLATWWHREKIKQLILERTSKLTDAQLYTYATLLKDTDIESDILAILEARIS